MVPLVLEFLSHADGAVRSAAREAAKRLLHPEHPDARAVEPIAALLGRRESAEDERPALLRLLGQTGSPAAIAHIVPFATVAWSPALRVAAMDALGDLGTMASAQAALQRALVDDEDATVRAHAASSLARTGSPATVDYLWAHLASDDNPDREAFAVALTGAIGRVTSPTLIRRLFRDATRAAGPLRDAMLDGLGRSGTREAQAALSTLVTFGDVADRRKGAELLSAAQGGREALTRLLRDPEASVRANAVWSLGVSGQGTDLAVVSPLLRDPAFSVAANAAVALGRLGQRDASVSADARRHLCGALDDRRSAVRASSLAGLRALQQRCDGEGPGDPERRRLLGDLAPTVRLSAAVLCGPYLGTTTFVRSSAADAKTPWGR